MNIFEKMLEISSEIKNISKNLEVGIGANSYKAVGEADVLCAVKELEAKYKIYSYPAKRTIVASEILETERTYNGKTTKGSQIFLRIETVYKFVNVENPDESIEIISYGDGIDTQDKAVGKAMTYADKYALMKAYKIISGDDPDQDKSPDNVVRLVKTELTKDEKDALKELAKSKGVALTELLKKVGWNGSNLTREQYDKALELLKDKK